MQGGPWKTIGWSGIANEYSKDFVVVKMEGRMTRESRRRATSGYGSDQPKTESRERARKRGSNTGLVS
jgi:hypothetical protein